MPVIKYADMSVAKMGANVDRREAHTENLMLTACAKGLGTCWIGFAQNWLATPDGKAALGLPAPYAPVAPIVVGHPRRQPPPVPRKNPEILWINAEAHCA